MKHALASVLVVIAFVAFCLVDPHGTAATAGTQHYSVSSGADDGNQRLGGYDVHAQDTEADENQSSVPAERLSPLFRFPNVQLAQGETVDSAVVTVWNDFGYYVGADWKIEDGNCADLERNPTIYGRTFLPVSVPWYSFIPRPSRFTAIPVVSPNLAPLINAWAAQSDHHKGDAACLALIADDEGSPFGDHGQVGFDPVTLEGGHPATLDVS